MNLLNILLQTSSSGGGLSIWILFAGVMLIFYLFMILPEQRKKKQQEQFRNALSKGDHVVTIGGIHGKIHAIDEHTITLMIDKTKMVFDKHAISSEASKKVQKEATTE